jgi:hypothetical protein
MRISFKVPNQWISSSENPFDYDFNDLGKNFTTPYLVDFVWAWHYDRSWSLLSHREARYPWNNDGRSDLVLGRRWLTECLVHWPWLGQVRIGLRTAVVGSTQWPIALTATNALDIGTKIKKSKHNGKATVLFFRQWRLHSKVEEISVEQTRNDASELRKVFCCKRLTFGVGVGIVTSCPPSIY